MAANAGVVAPPRYAPARPGELARSALDPGRAAIHLGWKPWTKLDQGTSAVLKWMAKSRPAPEDS
jgi:UDP-glucose 4-epimerase